MATPLTVSLSINGETAEAISVADGTEPLLYVLRNRFGLHGPKFGCGVAQCGSCTVHVNGAIARSCITRMIQLKNGDEITTLEGLIGTNEAVPGPRNGKSIDLASRKGPGAVLVRRSSNNKQLNAGTARMP
ncbi:MAG: 2Fe-2S iron-sulfur cluster binding domain-containing protein [Acidobacteriaceae bacterium]|nr:2Fe-2S iron-sulfur cluster binding domain-containing protein [Acidobacteriaceae bacterium]